MKRLGLVLVALTMLLAGCFAAPDTAQVEYIVVTATPKPVPPTPTPEPAPLTTLEFVLSKGYEEFPMDCASGSCRAFDNDDLGVRFILFKSGVVCMFPKMEAGYDLNTQLDLVAEVFYLEDLGTDAIQWMYRNAANMERGDAEVKVFSNNGIKHQLIMVLVPNKAGELVLNININPPGTIQTGNSSSS